MATNPPATNAQTAIEKASTSPLFVKMAQEYQLTPASLIDTLVKTVFPHGPNDPAPTLAQVAAFMSVAHQYRLNPFLKQIYAFPDKRGGIIPVVPVDGWVDMVQRNEKYNGVKFVFHWDDGSEGAVPKEQKAKVFAITTVLFRKGQDHPTEVTEYFGECFMPGKEPWQKWPLRMLRHKSYIQCARIAFGISGIYDEDEAIRIQETAGSTVIEGKKQVESGTLDKHLSTLKPSTEPNRGHGNEGMAAKSAEPPQDEVKPGELIEMSNGVLAQGTVTKVWPATLAGDKCTKPAAVEMGTVRVSTFDLKLNEILTGKTRAGNPFGKFCRFGVVVSKKGNATYYNIERIVSIGDTEFLADGTIVMSSDEAANLQDNVQPAEDDGDPGPMMNGEDLFGK